MKLKAFTVLAALAILFTVAGSYQTVSAHHNNGHCPAADETSVKDESGTAGVFTVAAPAGQVFTKVYVKAGSEASGAGCFPFTSNGSDGCYSISGLGTATVSVVKVGEGSDCKDISHIEGVLGGQGRTNEPEVPNGQGDNQPSVLAGTSTELNAAALLLLGTTALIAVRLRKQNA